MLEPTELTSAQTSEAQAGTTVAATPETVEDRSMSFTSTSSGPCELPYEALITTLIHSEVILHLLDSHDHRITPKDVWDLNGLADEVGMPTEDIIDALQTTWEIEDSTKQLIQGLGASFSTLVSEFSSSDKSNDSLKEVAGQSSKTTPRVRFGDIQGIPPSPMSDTSETSVSSATSSITWKYTGDKTWNVGLPAEALEIDLTSTRTCICDNCGFFFCGSISDLYPEVDEEYEYHGFCFSCLARVDATSSASSNASEYSDSAEEDEVADYPLDGSLNDGAAADEDFGDIADIKPIHPYPLDSIPYIRFGLPKTLPTYSLSSDPVASDNLSHDTRPTQVLKQRGKLCRPVPTSGMPATTLTNAEVEMLPTEEAGNSSREEEDNDWLLDDVMRRLYVPARIADMR